MRHLIALFACSLAVATASANDTHDAHAAKSDHEAAKPAAAASEPASAKAVASIKPSIKPSIAPPAPAAAHKAKEDEAELDLSERIAVRLAEMRATQAARAGVAAAKARKAAEARKREVIVATPPPPPPAHGTHWSYEGESGPANWSKINVDWGKCATGQRQSPIDLRDGIKVDLEQVSFDYHPSSFNEIDNGHTIQVNVGGGNFITVNNQTYELQQFHFHRPSEERINGKGTEMVMHLVHKSAEGKLAVVAVLLERGKAHNIIQTVWNNLPLEKLETVAPSVVLDLAEALPARARLLYLHGLVDDAAVHRGRAVDRDEADHAGIAGADGAVFAPVSAQCATGTAKFLDA